jgi:hypothetical protein
MIKKELIQCLEEKIDRLVYDTQMNIEDRTVTGDNLIRNGVELYLIKNFLEFSKKEKAFKNKVSVDNFSEVFSETVKTISTNLLNYMKIIMDSENLVGLNILKEELDKSRKSRGK